MYTATVNETFQTFMKTCVKNLQITFELREDGLYEIHDRKKDGVVETYRYYFEGDYLILTTEHKNIVMKRYFKKSN